MFRERNLPPSLRPVVEAWDRKGIQFYVGPENLFTFKGKKIKYLANPDIPMRPRSWYAATDGVKFDRLPDLTTQQVEDVATHLARDYRPERFVLLVDYRCNYRCPMCPHWGEGYVGDYWNERESLRRVVPKEEVLADIDKLADNGVQAVCITSPGELFLYPDWREVTSYAAKKGMFVTTITNGSFLDKKTVQDVRDCGIGAISVSLDAVSQPVYAKVRTPSARHYEIAMNAPLLLKEEGLFVSVAFVVQDANRHEKQAFLDHWRSTPVDEIYIGYETEYHDGYSVAKEQLAADEFAHGLCAWWGNYLVQNNGNTTGCCGMTLVYRDDESHGLPRVDFRKNSYDDVMKSMSDLISRPDSPLLETCRNCAMYTLPVTEEEYIGGWAVSRMRGMENWRRYGYKLRIRHFLERNAPGMMPLAQKVYRHARVARNNVRRGMKRLVNRAAAAV